MKFYYHLGFELGLGSATRVIGMPITGQIGDHWGLQDATRFQAFLGAATFNLA